MQNLFKRAAKFLTTHRRAAAVTTLSFVAVCASSCALYVPVDPYYNGAYYYNDPYSYYDPHVNSYYTCGRDGCSATVTVGPVAPWYYEGHHHHEGYRPPPYKHDRRDGPHR